MLDQGRVVEQGSHAELMAAGGVYSMLFGMQAAGYQAPDDASEAAPWSPVPFS